MAERLSSKQLDRYRDQLTLAHRHWDAKCKPTIDRMARYYRGDQWPKAKQSLGPGAIPPVVANLIFSDVKIMLPALALRNARVYCKPTKASRSVTVPQPDGTTREVLVQDLPTPDGQIVGVPILAAAQAKELLANWRWRELRLVQQVRRVLMDCLLAPFGVMRFGYSLETEKLEPTSGEELEPHELIKANSPFAVRWSPRQFRVDPEARYPDLSDAGWVAFGWLARPEDLRRNPRFSNTKNLKGLVTVRASFADELDAPERGKEPPLRLAGDEEHSRVQVWELWDKRTHKRLVLAEDHARSLEYVDWPHAYEGFPAETLVLSETPEALYGLPDLWHALWAQDAYNELSAMALVQTKRQLRKFLTRTGAMEQIEKDKLTSPIDGVVADVNGELKDAFMPVDMGGLSPDIYTNRVGFRDDHDRLSGLGDFMRGVAEKVDTATEASLIQANQSVRVNDARSLVEDFAGRMTRKLLQIDAQTLSVPAMIPVVGAEGALALGQFMQIQDRALLQAETDVEVEIGSMQPINQAQRRRDMGEVYTVWKDDPTIEQVGLRQALAQVYQDTLPHLGKLILSREQVAAMAPALMGAMGGDAAAAAGGGLPAPGQGEPMPPPQAAAGV